MESKNKKKSRVKPIIICLIVLLFLTIAGLFVGGIWSASNQLLHPVWKGVEKDLSVCNPETEKAFGKDCGNLRKTHEFTFSEVRIPSVNGYNLPGWFISSAENGTGSAQGAIMLIHAGGSDRRDQTKFIKFFLNRQLDVLTFDYSCFGEAPCVSPGLSYGERESQDVLSAYLYLVNKGYDKMYAMGTSVGASALLIALPSMPLLTAAVAENPAHSFERLISETPSVQGVPGWFTHILLEVTMHKGEFDGLANAKNALQLVKTTPVYFIQSKEDEINPYQATVDLIDSYKGPKTVWYPEKGKHAMIWNLNPADYERRLTEFFDSVQ